MGLLIITRITIILLLLAAVHLFHNIPNKSKTDKIFGIIIIANLVHNLFYLPVSLIGGANYKYIDDVAPFSLLYGPLLLTYCKSFIGKAIKKKFVVLHSVPIVLAWIAYFVFVFNQTFRETYYVSFYKFIFVFIGISVLSYSIYILFFSKKVNLLSEIYYFCWFLLIGGLLMLFMSNNITQESLDASLSQKENIFSMLIFTYMFMGALILFLWSLSHFRNGIMAESTVFIPKISNVPNQKEIDEISTENSLSKEGIELTKNFFSSDAVTDLDITIKSAAMEIGITQHLLKQIIESEYETSFNKLLTIKRIQYACMLIETNEKEILENLPNLSGFSSVGTFYRNFKEQVGMSPLMYKKEIDKKKEEGE